MARRRNGPTVLDLIIAYPRQATWFGLVFGIMCVLIGISAGNVGTVVISLVIAVPCACLVTRWRLQKVAQQRAVRRAAEAEIAARADAQHTAVMQGDEWGVYGFRDRPPL
jgi:hypothetical protein